MLDPSLLGRLSFTHAEPTTRPLPPGRNRLGIDGERDAVLFVPVIETGSPLARQLNEHGVCHGHMLVSSKPFDAKSLNILYSLCKSQNERMLIFQMLALDNITWHGPAVVSAMPLPGALLAPARSSASLT
jgi:hypothetical protein